MNWKDNAIIHVPEFSVQTLCLICRRNRGFSLNQVTMPPGTLQSLCRIHLLFTDVFSFDFVRIILKWQCIKPLTFYNLIHRLAQFRERGIQSRIIQRYIASKEPNEQPTTIDVSMVTVAPILVVLAAGYVIGIFVLLIERCVHGNILKFWPCGRVRKWR